MVTEERGQESRADGDKWDQEVLNHLMRSDSDKARTNTWRYQFKCLL